MTRVEKRAAAVWNSGTAFTATSGSGHSIVLDGESQVGMSPMEALLVSLITCSGADVVSILEKKRQAVTRFEIEVSGLRAEEHPRVYTDIRVNFIVTGRGVDPEAVRRAIELSETKYCSVSAMLEKTAAMTFAFEVREASAIAA
jgi:putative redox protein